MAFGLVLPARTSVASSVSTLAFSSVSLADGNAGSTAVCVRSGLSQDLSGDVDCMFVVAPLTSKAGVDYTSTYISFGFAPIAAVAASVEVRESCGATSCSRWT